MSRLQLRQNNLNITFQQIIKTEYGMIHVA